MIETCHDLGLHACRLDFKRRLPAALIPYCNVLSGGFFVNVVRKNKEKTEPLWSYSWIFNKQKIAQLTDRRW